MKTIKKGQKVKNGKGIVDRTKDPSYPSSSQKELCKIRTRKVLAIDPGKLGAFVLFDGKNFKSWLMPLSREGKDEFVDFVLVRDLIREIAVEAPDLVHVMLERAVSFGMGTKGAFNYGRGFAALEIALTLSRFPVTYVEPGKWTKEMHAGISSDIKPKAKSLIAVKRLFPQLVESMPRSAKGKLLDGPVDALLIAAYGLRQLGVPMREAESETGIEYDFM